MRQLKVTSGERLLLFGGGGSLARELGAIPVRYGPGVAGRVRALGAVDAVFDAAGRGVLADAIALLADGRLRLRAHTSMPMQEAAEAHRQLESGTVHERIILTLS